jgi:CheY-like chemotaxis protein
MPGLTGDSKPGLAAPEPVHGDAADVLLIDDQPDHALLVADLLAHELPEVRVQAVTTEDRKTPPPRAAPIVLLALNTRCEQVLDWLAGFDGESALVLLRGPGEQWPAQAASRLLAAAECDKREGDRFAGKLVATVREQLARRRSTPAAVVREPEPEPATPSRAADEAPSRPGTAPPGELALAGLLAGQAAARLARLEPLADLYSVRVPGDPAVARYSESLREELRAAGRLVELVRELAEAGPAAPSMRLGVGELVGLRVGAWRLAGAEIALALEPGSQQVELRLDVIGPLLDDLVQELRLGAGGGTVGVEVDGRPAPAARARVESADGRWVCVRLACSVDAAPASTRSRRDAVERLLRRGRCALAAHGGTLEVEWSDDGTRLRAVELLFPPAVRRAADPRGLRPAGMPATVLVVDDEPGLRALAEEVLRARGHTVLALPSGTEAVERYRAGCRYDLVLLDLLMPGLGGGETYRQIRRYDPAARVVLVSGSATGAQLRDLLLEGLLGFLPKPFNVRQLLRLVDGVLEPGPEASPVS